MPVWRFCKVKNYNFSFFDSWASDVWHFCCTGWYYGCESQRKMSALEVIGFLFCIYLLWSIVSALFNLLYTCYLGNALGRSIDVKRLGSWAGEFIALDPYIFSYLIVAHQSMGHNCTFLKPLYFLLCIPLKKTQKGILASFHDIQVKVPYWTVPHFSPRLRKKEDSGHRPN